MYKLKKGIENFQVVDGAFAGKKFIRGKEYPDAEIPPEEKHKFEKIKSRSQKSEVRSQKQRSEGKGKD